MPFTPFHAGIALLLWALAQLDVVALLLGALLPDAEGFLFLLRVYPTAHGPLHSILGAALLAIPVAALSFGIRKRLGALLPAKVIFISALLGTFSHLLLDAPTAHPGNYSSVLPWLPDEDSVAINLAWPLGYWNPLYGIASPQQAALLSVASLIAALLIKRKRISNRLRRLHDSAEPKLR
jgi:hypothetical protein